MLRELGQLLRGGLLPGESGLQVVYGVALVLTNGQAQPADQLPILDAVHVERLSGVLLAGRRPRLLVSLVLKDTTFFLNQNVSQKRKSATYFFNDGPQGDVAGQGVHTRRGQLHHAATVGAFDGQAKRAPYGVIVGRLQQVLQARFAEGVRAREDPGVGEQLVAHGASQVLLQAVHDGEERPGSGLQGWKGSLESQENGQKTQPTAERLQV